MGTFAKSTPQGSADQTSFEKRGRSTYDLIQGSSNMQEDLHTKQHYATAFLDQLVSEVSQRYTRC
jgi:hypothetical protein